MLLTLTVLLSTPVFAAQAGGFIDPSAPAVSVQKGGFTGPDGTVATVKQAQDMKDDAWVTMRGNIEKRLGHEEYSFRDATGTMMVEIDDDRWAGQTVSPSDKVELRGKLDKDFNSLELDVKEIRKVN